MLPLAFATLAVASEATLRVKARLREGPSKETRLLGWVDPGVTVTIVGTSRGWQQVQAPDGRTGWIWREHFASLGTPTTLPALLAVATSTPPSTAPGVGTPPPSANTALAEQVATLQAEVAALKTRTPPAADEIERLRGEIARLATAQRALEDRLGSGATLLPVAPGASPSPLAYPIDAPPGAAGIFLLIGGVVGWIGALIVKRIRDRRQRIRI